MISKFNPTDITQSATYNKEFYLSENTFEQSKDLIFANTWQLIADTSDLKLENTCKPVKILEHFLDENVLIVNDNNSQIDCISNVCTHRGMLLVQSTCKQTKIRCPYHGRRFALNGEFEYMPEFEDANDLPTQQDNLAKVPHFIWKDKFVFASITPKFEIKDVLDKLEERIGFLPFKDFIFSNENSREYIVHAHWALYCENYLEGLHIPFVHSDLNAVLDYGDYKTILDTHFSLQIGYSKGKDNCFELPLSHIDFGKHISAYYYMIFPNLMLNFYPWGLSINIVKPINKIKTRVSFLTYIYDESKMEQGAGAGLDKVEREDEYVVENVQKGLQSRFYKNGRFSPKRETGVHHFQTLIQKFMETK